VAEGEGGVELFGKQADSRRILRHSEALQYHAKTVYIVNKQAYKA
jgi:hypothetical protein